MTTFVLDASVAVAAARKSEPHHAAALARIHRVLRGTDDIVVPVIFEIEVASALARRGQREVAIRRWVAALLDDAAVIDIGRREAVEVARVAVRARLRAADAVYVWAAGNRSVPLCTLDEEVRKRATAECMVMPA